ncbi:MAG TPA: GIY-YIG nuclease family protein [Cyclobacteriaceae bacterium]|mgnify:FL=1|nr:GIY-YIG nuclease family protein [Cyclobacteriaceae bacterium]
MQFYVYILESMMDGTFYKGYSHDYLKRLDEHNSGLSRYTASKRPWRLIYAEKCVDKRAALIREKQLKRLNKEYLKWLLNQHSNLIR